MMSSGILIDGRITFITRETKTCMVSSGILINYDHSIKLSITYPKIRNLVTVIIRNAVLLILLLEQW